MLRSPQTHHIKAGDLLHTDMVTIVHRHRYNVPLYLCEHINTKHFLVGITYVWFREVPQTCTKLLL